MPPHLHPRSTATSTLFAGTLLASFIVVGIPHVFPCPRPRTGYAADAGPGGEVIAFEQDGKVIKRVVKSPSTKAVNGRTTVGEDITVQGMASTLQQAQQQTNSKTTSTAGQVPHIKSRDKVPQSDLDEEAQLFRELEAEAAMLDAKARQARECPVPKPSDWIGRILRFDGKATVDPTVGSGKG